MEPLEAYCQCGRQRQTNLLRRRRNRHGQGGPGTSTAGIRPPSSGCGQRASASGRAARRPLPPVRGYDCLQSVPDTYVVVFSDGLNNKTSQCKRRLGTAEVFDDEAEGAYNGLLCAYNTYTWKRNPCLPRQHIGSKDSFISFQKLTAIVTIHLHWVSGHEGIEENEEADCMAKKVAAFLTDSTWWNRN